MPLATYHRSGDLLPGRAQIASRAVIAVATGCAFAFMVASANLSAPTVTASDLGAQRISNVALARTFTDALNGHDVEALVGLFSEEGPGSTVHADRYAWTKFEIRLWAQQQVRANVRVDSHDFWATDHGASWSATVYREDWREHGVNALSVLNAISVEDGKIVDFTSSLANPLDAERLQHLWQAGGDTRLPCEVSRISPASLPQCEFGAGLATATLATLPRGVQDHPHRTTLSNRRPT